MGTPKILLIDDKAEKSSYPRKSCLDVLITDHEYPLQYKAIAPIYSLILKELENIDEYDLVLVDYIFESLPDSLFRSGGPLYSLIRDYSKTIPIYLISVLQSNINQIGDFDYFISDEKMSEAGFLYNEVIYHKQLKNITGDSTQHLLELLKAPSSDYDDMESCLPPQVRFRNSQEDSKNLISLIDNVNISLFRWLAHIFFERDGFLISIQYLACHLGVSVEFISSRISIFDRAKYKGIFSSTRNERWWKSIVEDIIYDFDSEGQVLSNFSFQEGASKLLKSSDSDLARCIKCDGYYPESLGYIEGQDTHELYSVHIRCSAQDETKEEEPFFVNPRVIAEEEFV